MPAPDVLGAAELTRAEALEVWARVLARCVDERGRIDFNPVGKVQSKKRRSAIPIPRRLMAFLKFAASKRTSDYVLAADGRAVASVKRSFATACKNAGLEGVTPHTLCHTCASWLAQAGVPIGKAAAFMDRSESVFERIYAKHDPNHMQEVLDALG